MMKSTLMVLCVLMLTFTGLSAQERTVSGTVQDETGNPLVGVSVVIAGTTTGTVTDIEGSYTLSVTGDNPQLQFSFIGYVTVTERVGSRTVVNVTMQEDVTQLGEVVISALGFEQVKDQMGATYSEVNTSDIRRSGEANFLNSMAGKAAGVQIQRSNGDPGAGTTIRIRGANTITGATSPLIIIDGIPVSNSTVYGGGNNVTGGRSGGTSQQSRLNDLNPADIESVQILKGASAAALWGSRAANGVVVITTKNGAAGKVNITYNASRSFDVVQERFDIQNTFGQGRNGVYSPTRSESWGDYIPDRSGGPDDVNTSGQYFEALDGTRYYPITQKNSTETFVDSNWDQIFQTGGFWQHDMTISGGTDKGTYFMSVANMAQEGIIKNSDYDRTNLRLNTRFFFTDWLTVTSKAGYVTSSSNRIQQSSNTAGLLLGTLRTPPDFDITHYKGTYVNSSGTEFSGRHRSYRRYLGGPSTNPTYNNPLWTINEQESTTDVDRFTMSTELNITPMENFDITLRGGTDNYTDKRLYFFPVGSAGSRNPGILAEDHITEQELNFDAIAKTKFELTPDLSLNATVGWNINDRSREILSSSITGFLVNADKPTTALNGSNDASTFNKTRRFIRSNRGYGVLNFGFRDAVFLNVSGASEAASSISGVFFYPAADLAFQISEFVDLSNTPLSFLKFRASYGQVGVQPSPHRFQTLAETGFSYSTYSDPLDIGLFGGGFRIDDDRGNPDLRPEIKTEWEIGLDTRLFDDRLGLIMTYYQNEITDMLLNVALTPSSGGDTQYTNAATMENKGFELEMDYNIVRKQDLNVDMFVRWSTNENLVTDLKGTESVDLSTQSVSSRAVVGYSIGALYGTTAATDDNGNYILDGNGFPTVTDPQVIGDPNPDWRGTLGMRASWKGFGLNAIMEHSQGGDFSPRTLFVLNGFGTTQETANWMMTSTDLVNYDGDVIPAGTQVRGRVANFGAGDVLLDESWYRTGPGGGFGDGRAYGLGLRDATWTRLRELSLTYTLNSGAFRERTKLNSITFGVTGRNLFLKDNIVGIDPEINQTGVGNSAGLDYFTNPATKSYLFTVSVNY